MTRAKYVYRGSPSLEAIRLHYGQRLGYSHPLAFFSNFERARVHGAPLGAGECVVVREAYPEELQGQPLRFVSLRLTRSHFTGLLDPNRKSLAKARAIYIPKG